MRRPEFIARQSSRPSGFIGRVIARIMAKETAALNDLAIDLLAPAADDDILEVGFGHGATIERLVDRLDGGHITGIDPSATMVRVASRRNRRAIAAERVDLQLGSSDALTVDDASFDKVLAVHTIYFWKDPLAHLVEIRRVLRPGGRFALGFTPKGDPHAESFPATVYRFYSADEVRGLLERAGFIVESVDNDATGKHVAIATVPAESSPAALS